MSKGCFWIVVENRDAEKFRDDLQRLYETNDNITYVCGQLEKGTNLHFQSYMQLQIAKPLSWMKNVVSKTAHLELQYKTASAESGKHYASKPHEGCDCKECILERETPTVIPDTFVEYGQIRKKGTGPGQGSRTDLIELRDKIKTGARERDIVEDDDLVVTYANNLKFHDRIRMLYPPPPLENGVDVRLYVGEPGAGKTRKAYAESDDLYEVPIDNGTKWYDGYDQHKVMLFDDFAGKVDHITLVNTLKLFDRYVRKIPVKGTHTWLRSEIVIVTSNYHPRAWYDWTTREKSYKALCRRFKSITVFEEPRDDEFEEVVIIGRKNIKDYFYDRDLWPIQSLQTGPVTGRVGFEGYE